MKICGRSEIVLGSHVVLDEANPTPIVRHMSSYSFDLPIALQFLLRQ